MSKHYPCFIDGERESLAGHRVSQDRHVGDRGSVSSSRSP